MAGHPRAGAAGPGVRVGHLRRRWLEPRPHRPHRRPDRHRHHAGADGAPHRGVALGHRAAPRHRLASRGRHPQHPGAARRPARRTRSASGSPHPEGLHVRRRAGPAGAQAGRLLRRRRGVPVRAPALGGPGLGHATSCVAKFRAGAEFAITQLFLEPEGFLRLRDRLAAPGLRRTRPAGDHAADLASARCTAGRSCPGRRCPRRWSSGWSASRGTRWRSAPRAWRSPRELCDRLIAEGVQGLHFYTLNRSTATTELVRLPRTRGAGHRGLPASADGRRTGGLRVRRATSTTAPRGHARRAPPAAASSPAARARSGRRRPPSALISPTSPGVNIQLTVPPSVSPLVSMTSPGKLILSWKSARSTGTVVRSTRARHQHPPAHAAQLRS